MFSNPMSTIQHGWIFCFLHTDAMPECNLKSTLRKRGSWGKILSHKESAAESEQRVIFTVSICGQADALGSSQSGSVSGFSHG